MPIKAKLKFPDPLPWVKEARLINEGGFVVYARKRGEYLILEKRAPEPGLKQGFETLVGGELPDDVKLELTRKCEKVLNDYLDPDAHATAIKARLERMAMAMPKYRSRFILDWIISNVENDDVIPLPASMSK